MPQVQQRLVVEPYPKAVFEVLGRAHDALQPCALFSMPVLSAVLILDIWPLIGPLGYPLIPAIWIGGGALCVRFSDLFCRAVPRLSPFVSSLGGFAERRHQGPELEALLETIAEGRRFSVVVGLGLLSLVLALSVLIGAWAGPSWVGRLTMIFGLHCAALMLWGRIATGGQQPGSLVDR